MIFNFETGQAKIASKVKTIDSKSSDEKRRRVTIKEVSRIAKQTDIVNTQLNELDVILRVISSSQSNAFLIFPFCLSASIA